MEVTENRRNSPQQASRSKAPTKQKKPAAFNVMKNLRNLE